MRHGMWGIVVWLQVITTSVWAYQPTEWNQGELLLQNGTELKGELNFNWAAQVVQYRQGATIKAYSASQVQSFAYFDQQRDALRKFACVNLLDKPGHARLCLLEEMVGGSVVVYRQVHCPHGLIHVTQVSGLLDYGELAQSVDNFSYWVLSDDTLLNLAEFYRRVWPQVSSPYGTALTQNARRMGWNLNSTIGRLQQISVYNALVKQTLQQLLPGPVTIGN